MLVATGKHFNDRYWCCFIYPTPVNKGSGRTMLLRFPSPHIGVASFRQIGWDEPTPDIYRKVNKKHIKDIL
jgi:hypothetical protein